MAVRGGRAVDRTTEFKRLDDALGVHREELAHGRFNAGFNYRGSRYLGGASLNYSSSAFWSDVLTSPYAGYTDAFTLVNASAGMKWTGDRMVGMIKVTNLLNQDVQQHVFGDILKRSVSFEVRIHQ